MNCHEDIWKFFDNIKFNYKFDDDVKCGNHQSNPKQFLDKHKILIQGSLLNDDDIKSLSNGLPDILNLSNFAGEIYNQSDIDLAVCCAITSAIEIRTNYINNNRYRITKFIFGNWAMSELVGI